MISANPSLVHKTLQDFSNLPMLMFGSRQGNSRGELQILLCLGLEC